IWSLCVYNGKLYAGTADNGIIYVFDDETWSTSYDSPETDIWSLCVYNGKLYAGTYPNGIIYVFDGSTWSTSYDSPEAYIFSLCVYNGKLYAGTAENGIIYAGYSNLSPPIIFGEANINVNIAAQSANVNVNIAASAVTLNVAIQSSAVTLNVNIAASAVTLNVAIQSSAVTLNVNIAASAVTMNVNIAASAVTINMDIKAQTVAVKTQGEWSPQAGQQRYVTYYRSGATGTVGYLDISPTSGKTLYITHLSFHTSAQASASADHNQMGAVMLLQYVGSIYLVHLGGNGGAGMVFPTPIKIPDGTVVRMYLANWADHTCEQYSCWGGYEI
ncbi:MAG: hypothetical protein Q8J76_07635, partial [Desulfobulbaceae bacterium]|nr:hypothetical protein [Desulfobulbaceae bacterium]